MNDLLVELKDLQEMNFELGLLGFDEDELQKLLGQEITEGLTDPDDVPEPPKVAVTKPGDIWLLGAYTTCPHCKEKNYVNE